ncbi:hypothetical protein [Microbacterium sp. NPDC089696]|uniref:hypothetical protein n=1 Tax=Microbacterium sp. NPDC089696 TaxID=3364199 RepID=UPI003817E233
MEKGDDDQGDRGGRGVLGCHSFISVIDPGIIVPGIIFGPLIIGLGVWLATHSRRAKNAIYDQQRMLLGKRIADLSAGGSSPRALRVVGALFVMFGLWFMFGAVVALVQFAARA